MSAPLAGKEFKNILIIGAIGIGNLLMFRPTLESLRRRFPMAYITMLVLKKGFADVFTRDPLINETMVVDFREYTSIGRKIALIARLRQKKFDLVMTSFPANRLEYNLLAFLTGAAVRVAHCYPRKQLRSLSFLQNVRIPVKPGIHDVEQNFNLLQPSGITAGPEKHRLKMVLSQDEIAFGKTYVQKLSLDPSRKIIGIHPGSSEEHQMIYKRWPKEHFAGLIDRLAQEYQAAILMFGGPGEEPILNEITALCKTTPISVKGLNLREAASVIQCCHLFVTNDSGLMHIAVAMGCRTIALFGPTEHIRTAPYGAEHRVIRKRLDCSPCWKLQDVGFRQPCIYPTRRCLEELSVEEVVNQIREVM